MADDSRSPADDGRLSPNLPTHYANLINVTSSFHDVRLAFGKTIPPETHSYQTVVYMSYQAAKQLSTLLSNSILAYEQMFGEIPIMTKEKQKEDG